jgi:hypothetical protein
MSSSFRRKRARLAESSTNFWDFVRFSHALRGRDIPFGEAQTNSKTMAPFVKSQAAILTQISKMGVGRDGQPTNISWSDDSGVAMKAYSSGSIRAKKNRSN